MIFFQFYTERWLAATVGMTGSEEGAYLRLVIWMYVNESELPLDVKECYRIARCNNRAEREAVRNVLVRKFCRTSSGHSQQKTAFEITKFQHGTPARESRKAIDAERKRRSREEQRRLYADARQKGLKTRGGMTLNELRELLGLAQVFPIGVTERPVRTRPENPSFHEPLTIEHPKEKPLGRSTDAFVSFREGEIEAKSVENRLEGGPVDPIETAPQTEPERIAAAVRALRSGGLQGINAGHPLLHALVAAGASPDAFTYAAAHAVGKGKPFAYALAVVQGQMQDAAQAQAQGLAVPPERNRVSEWAPGLEAKTGASTVEQWAPSIASKP